LRETIPPSAGEVAGPGQIAKYWARHLTALTAGADGWWPDEGDWFNITLVDLKKPPAPGSIV